MGKREVSTLGTRHAIRVIVPDSHGAHADAGACAALLRDVNSLDPDEIVLLGDHLDCGGTFSAHQRNYSAEITESYVDDLSAAIGLLDGLAKAAPRARVHYLEGNHEGHVERWCARNFERKQDADLVLDRIGPEQSLGLKKRGITYYKRSVHYQGLSIPGTIRLGKCHFTHGICFSAHAAHAHLIRFGANVVFGHVHRSQSVVERTVTSDGHGAWCPGTLAKLQPLYRHTTPTSWSHGYGLQFVNQATGTFVHWNVPIYKGQSLLLDAIDTIHKRKRK